MANPSRHINANAMLKPRAHDSMSELESPRLKIHVVLLVVEGPKFKFEVPSLKNHSPRMTA